MRHFSFDFSSPLALPLLLVGVGPRSSAVQVGDGHLDARFGPWRLRVPFEQISGVHVTGPYNPLLSLGLRISLRDRGLTFGTSPRHGVCVSFREPVRSVVPGLLVRHPAVTLTVTDPDGLAAELVRQVRGQVDPDELDDALVQRVETEDAEREARRRDMQREAQREERERDAKRQAQREARQRRTEARESDERENERQSRQRQNGAGRTSARTTSPRQRTARDDSARDDSPRTTSARTSSARKTSAGKTPARKTPARKAPARKATAGSTS